MNITINLGERESSIVTLEQLGHNEYVPFDVQITNSHIMDLNNLIGRKVFRNNLLYINSETLHDIMKNEEGKGQHNYHGLSPEDVYMALSSIKDPQYVFVAKYNRYAIISVELSHLKLPLMLVIEAKAKLIKHLYAEINKIVTIYPKDQIDKYIEKLGKGLLLYKKP